MTEGVHRLGARYERSFYYSAQLSQERGEACTLRRLGVSLVSLRFPFPGSRILLSSCTSVGVWPTLCPALAWCQGSYLIVNQLPFALRVPHLLCT